MAGWLIPALKAVLPHVGTIISAAKPVFTKKGDETAANQAALVQKQIGELQSAVAQNAANIKELAVELQISVRRAWIVAIVAVALSAAALCAILWLIIAR